MNGVWKAKEEAAKSQRYKHSEHKWHIILGSGQFLLLPRQRIDKCNSLTGFFALQGAVLLPMHINSAHQSELTEHEPRLDDLVQTFGQVTSQGQQPASRGSGPFLENTLDQVPAAAENFETFELNIPGLS